ncbi:MAG TPA: protein-tyrosine-phosphatase, partial [Bacteroidia bacterium]|nr:protein-tyrosine-phosphatase [Bacteroidia bacterium]
NKPIHLIYVCTHNSRRSHFGQVWAQVAADYYQIENVSTFSGGTEATAFNPNAINALKRVGFKIESSDLSVNPLYQVFYSESTKPCLCFSKVYNHPDNPQAHF